MARVMKTFKKTTKKYEGFSKLTFDHVMVFFFLYSNLMELEVYPTLSILATKQALYDSRLYIYLLGF